jgi:hypothetical protein
VVNEHLSRWVVQGVANNRKLAAKLRTDGHKVFGPGVADIGLAESTYAIGVVYSLPLVISRSRPLFFDLKSSSFFRSTFQPKCRCDRRAPIFFSKSAQ